VKINPFSFYWACFAFSLNRFEIGNPIIQNKVQADKQLDKNILQTVATRSLINFFEANSSRSPEQCDYLVVFGGAENKKRLKSLI